jgi:gliding motility-associated-like protein
MNAKHFTPYGIIVLCMLFSFREAKAQVIAQDSLALVALYNVIPALHSDTTWLHGNVSTWNGVYLNGDKVDILVLNVLISGPIPTEVCGFDSLLILSVAGCDVRGLIPKCVFEMPSIRNLNFAGNSLTGVEAGTDFTKLTSIEAINLYYNELTDMPDFMSIPSPSFNDLGIENNHFNFDDLIPLLGKAPLYRYSPQQPMLPWRGFVVQAGDSANFPDVSVLAGDSNNTYQWKQQIGDSSFVVNSPRLKNTNQSMMRVEAAEVSDGGTYFCEMTNPNLPGLFLHSGFIAMNVTALIPQTIIYLKDTMVYCPFSPLLEATTTAHKSVSFVSLNDTVASVNSDNTLTLHQFGKVVIQLTVPADTVYKADTLNVELTVGSNYPLPALEIIQQLPTGVAKELGLSVPYSEYLTYQWTTPNGQIYDTAAIMISPFTTTDLGIYKMKVTEGSCFISELSKSINTLPYGKPVIYELITPNGDGDNETFYIENLNPALHNEISVFNTWHQIVFHQENYRNDWDGGDLPVGTYYYSVKVGEQNYKGNLYIKR